MVTDYDQIAEQYQMAKKSPWRLHIEHFTMFELLGDLSGKSVLDLACGEGYYSRALKAAGASRVLGIDLSAEMIKLARARETEQPLGVEYLVQDARDFQPDGGFDLVCAAYLLNYARTREELLDMYRAVARALKPGSRFVTVNDNPGQRPETFSRSRKYGFVKFVQEPVHEGSPIGYIFYLENEQFQIENYHLGLATHEWAAQSAGLRDVRFHAPRLSPAGSRGYEAGFWDDFLADQPVFFIECRR
jgi:ubiquinone/menaquinone biosynthesis C-methylase UbiE